MRLAKGRGGRASAGYAGGIRGARVGFCGVVELDLKEIRMACNDFFIGRGMPVSVGGFRDDDFGFGNQSERRPE